MWGFEYYGSNASSFESEWMIPIVSSTIDHWYASPSGKVAKWLQHGKQWQSKIFQRKEWLHCSFTSLWFTFSLHEKLFALEILAQSFCLFKQLNWWHAEHDGPFKMYDDASKTSVKQESNFSHIIITDLKKNLNDVWWTSKYLNFVIWTLSNPLTVLKTVCSWKETFHWDKFSHTGILLVNDTSKIITAPSVIFQKKV